MEIKSFFYHNLFWVGSVRFFPNKSIHYRGSQKGFNEFNSIVFVQTIVHTKKCTLYTKCQKHCIITTSLLYHCYRLDLFHTIKFFTSRLPYFLIYLPYTFPWNTVIMSGLLEFPIATWTVGFALAASHESFTDSWDVVSPNLSYRYYFSRYSYELAELVSIPYFLGSSTHYLNGLLVFLVTIPRCYNNVSINTFFPFTARL